MRLDDMKILDRIERSWLEPDEWSDDQEDENIEAEEECDEYE